MTNTYPPVTGLLSQIKQLALSGRTVIGLCKSQQALQMQRVVRRKMAQ
jgi:hypothetical protein